MSLQIHVFLLIAVPENEIMFYLQRVTSINSSPLLVTEVEILHIKNHLDRF